MITHELYGVYKGEDATRQEELNKTSGEQKQSEKDSYNYSGKNNKDKPLRQAIWLWSCVNNNGLYVNSIYLYIYIYETWCKRYIELTLYNEARDWSTFNLQIHAQIFFLLAEYILSSVCICKLASEQKYEYTERK